MELENKNILILKAIDKSNEAVESAEENYLNKHYETCQNRLYYAIFYIVNALAYKDNFITSKHAQLMGWFNKKYIYDDKIFESRLFAIYKEAYTYRQLSDYDFMYKPDVDELLMLIKDTKYFISVIKKYLNGKFLI
ncbi:HEPN domain-containing protein [bacterium]|nr:HEPN domain-containing protein [bacterium]